MKRKYKNFLVTILLVVISTSLNSSISDQMVYNINYLAGQPSNNKIIYYFHGATGDEKSWKSTFENLQFSENDIPTVISVSFGPYWFLTTGDGVQGQNVPIEHFVEVIMPEIESQLPFVVTSRAVMGHSMGAVNAGQLSFRYSELFDQVILLSTSILPISPYDDDDIINDYITNSEKKYLSIRSRIKKLFIGKSSLKSRIEFLLSSQKNRYPNEMLCFENNLFYYLENNEVNPELRVYLSCGTKDELSFLEGTRLLNNLLMKKGISVDYHEIPGGDHNTIEYQSISNFLNRVEL